MNVDLVHLGRNFIALPVISTRILSSSHVFFPWSLQTVLHSQWISWKLRVFLRNQFNKYFTIIYISEAPQRLSVHWTSHVLQQWISIPKFHKKVGFQVSPQWNAFWRLLNTHLRDHTSLPKSLFLKTHNQTTESVINYWLEPPWLVILPTCYLPHPLFLLVMYFQYFWDLLFAKLLSI